MPKRYYPAVIHKDSDSDFGVHFPDVPGCYSAGRTLEEAVGMAEEALNFHFDGLAEDDSPFPAASGLAEAEALARADRETGETVAAVQLIPAYLPDEVARINLSIDKGLLARIDSVAGHYGRSGWLAEAAREKLSSGTVVTMKDSAGHSRHRNTGQVEGSVKKGAVRLGAVSKALVRKVGVKHQKRAKQAVAPKGHRRDIAAYSLVRNKTESLKKR